MMDFSNNNSVGFDFNQMIDGLDQYVNDVQKYLKELESSSGKSVDLSTMFQLQFRMQIMTQYTEACSNTLSAVHNEMVTMARATKGQ